MTIQYIQELLSNDFEAYKKILLTNQKQILQKQKEECVFISVLSEDSLLKKIDETLIKSQKEYPLLGVPFAVKDNIDVFGFETTSGCKEYAFMPKKSAFAVAQLEKAGAICIGKTNMDQFATGLVGTRSFYGTAKNYYNEDYIPGGSSSGSASAVSAAYVAFSLGTDTAGSGRIPAAFQNLVGFKPSKGVVSTSGVVPACKSLDCVSVFSNSLDDVDNVLRQIAVYDPEDPYSRENVQSLSENKLKIAIPSQKDLKFFGNKAYEVSYHNFIALLLEKNYIIEEIDFSPMFKAAELLYGGPWLAERYNAVGDFINKNPNAVVDTTLKIISQGKALTATSYFEAEYQLNAFKKQFEGYTKLYDAFLMPTAGTIFTKKEVSEQPIDSNTKLGYYTNFMNLLDCTAIALPVAITDNNLPFGITLFGPAFNDNNLLTISRSMSEKKLLNTPMSETEFIELAVCGAHKTGGTLNYQLLEVNAIYKETLLTTPEYRFYALSHLDPVRPGLIKDPKKGGSIEVQVWKVPANKLGGFINQIGAPLTFGKINLENGEVVTSFLCESYALEKAKEITHLQTWENYLSHS